MSDTPRYSIGTGGESEPGLILIADHKIHRLVARSSELALKDVEELVAAANAGDAAVRAERARVAAALDGLAAFYRAKPVGHNKVRAQTCEQLARQVRNNTL